MGADEIRRTLNDVATHAKHVHRAAKNAEDSIVTAYNAGATLEAIAAASTINGNGIGQYTLEGVRKVLLRRNIPLRRRGRPTGAPRL